MKSFFKGIIFSLLLLAVFLLLRNGIELLIAFGLSLLISTIVFVLYVNKKKLLFKELVWISIGTGFFYIIFASIGITLFPVEEIRDLGDIVMPYVNAFIFGLFTVFVFIFFGFKYSKQKQSLSS
ncbi:hypothetical protein JMM81_13135 [Bacillus sp. V3B]|uniref:hypothetical protein n=1 Tax=Bacillus sp. V3B TaxID=2804915 RepID=UPI00210CF25D|nr:hypothetical protein [Bacillus sp. V3B]MCQ6275894.1 hypothetical protein [Bacillus sp. V3B]